MPSEGSTIPSGWQWSADRRRRPQYRCAAGRCEGLHLAAAGRTAEKQRGEGPPLKRLRSLRGREVSENSGSTSGSAADFTRLTPDGTSDVLMDLNEQVTHAVPFHTGRVEQGL